MKKYHFISGLPRSGSTLLVSILNQNPRFFAESSNALFGCYSSILPTIFNYQERSLSCSQEKIKKMLQSLVDSYYYDVDKEVVFNLDRGWTNVLDQLHITHTDSKIICCVRNISWIMDSYERAYNQRGLTIPKMFEKSFDSVYSRNRNLFPDGHLYNNYYGLKQAYYGPFKYKLCLIDYDDLVKDPEQSINKIYDFIGEEKFEHNFENLQSNYEEFDSLMGFPDLHKVKPKVEFSERQTILPPDIFDKYKDLDFWR